MTLGTVRIAYRAGSGGLFDRVRWRCSGSGESCQLWYASAWDWAPALAAEHVAKRHPHARVRGLVPAELAEWAGVDHASV